MWRPLAAASTHSLTQADVVVEEVQEVAALLPVVAAGGAGAPGPHVRGGVVQVVGGDGASCVCGGEEGVVVGGRKREGHLDCITESGKLNLTTGTSSPPPSR